MNAHGYENISFAKIQELVFNRLNPRPKDPPKEEGISVLKWFNPFNRSKDPPQEEGIMSRLNKLLDIEDLRNKLSKDGENYCSICLVEKRDTRKLGICFQITNELANNKNMHSIKIKDPCFVNLAEGRWQDMPERSPIYMVSLSKEVFNNRARYYKPPKIEPPKRELESEDDIDPENGG